MTRDLPPVAPPTAMPGDALAPVAATGLAKGGDGCYIPPPPPLKSHLAWQTSVPFRPRPWGRARTERPTSDQRPVYPSGSAGCGSLTGDCTATQPASVHTARLLSSSAASASPSRLLLTRSFSRIAWRVIGAPCRRSSCHAALASSTALPESGGGWASACSSRCGRLPSGRVLSTSGSGGGGSAARCSSVSSRWSPRRAS